MLRFKVDGAWKAISRAVAGLALLCVAGPALAQGRPAAEPSAQDLRALRQFARCIVQHEERRARDLITGDYRTDAYQAAMRRLAIANNGCLPPESRLASASMLLAGSLAEALLARSAPRGTLAQRVAPNAAAAPVQAYDEGEVTGLCVVRAAPAETEALLATPQGSAQEAAALRAVTPHLGPCLAAGATMRFNRPGLRALLALAAYRLVRHNQAVATAAAAGN